MIRPGAEGSGLGLPPDVLAAIPAPLFVLDPRGRIEYVNEAMKGLLGTSTPYGRRPLFVRAVADRGLRDRIVRTLSSETSWTGFVWLADRRFEVFARRVLGSGRVLVVAIDATREAELESRLQRAQRLEALGRLASGMVHDINNILTIIETTATFAQRAAGDHPELKEDLTEIRSAVRSAAQLSRQILSFSRRNDEGSAPLDVNRFIETAVTMLRRLVGDAIALETDLAPRLPRVSVDQSQLEQVVTNLVVNARDAMPSGGRIRLSTEVREVRPGEGLSAGDESPAGRYVVVGVRDNGVGMDEGTQSRIFEPFFTTKGPDEGTGLGLATVRSLVARNGGFVRMSSALGIGTEFCIHLPVLDASVSVNPVLSSASAS